MRIKPNLDSENKNWINSVNDNFENFITTWTEAVKRGELTSADVLRVVEKIAKLRGDENLVENIKGRISNS